MFRPERCHEHKISELELHILTTCPPGAETPNITRTAMLLKFLYTKKLALIGCLWQAEQTNLYHKPNTDKDVFRGQGSHQPTGIYTFMRVANI